MSFPFSKHILSYNSSDIFASWIYKLPFVILYSLSRAPPFLLLYDNWKLNPSFESRSIWRFSFVNLINPIFQKYLFYCSFCFFNCSSSIRKRTFSASALRISASNSLRSSLSFLAIAFSISIWACNSFSRIWSFKSLHYSSRCL